MTSCGNTEVAPSRSAPQMLLLLQCKQMFPGHKQLPFQSPTSQEENTAETVMTITCLSMPISTSEFFQYWQKNCHKTDNYELCATYWGIRLIIGQITNSLHCTHKRFCFGDSTWQTISLQYVPLMEILSISFIDAPQLSRIILGMSVWYNSVFD
jgi:hypothetical protein